MHMFYVMKSGNQYMIDTIFDCESNGRSRESLGEPYAAFFRIFLGI